MQPVSVTVGWLYEEYTFVMADPNAQKFVLFVSVHEFIVSIPWFSIAPPTVLPVTVHEFIVRIPAVRLKIPAPFSPAAQYPGFEKLPPVIVRLFIVHVAVTSRTRLFTAPCRIVAGPLSVSVLSMVTWSARTTVVPAPVNRMMSPGLAWSTA